MQNYEGFQFVAVFIVYFVIFIGFGVYQGRKVKSGEDYAIAGRSLPGWAAALSERATGESSWALLGLPGWAYAVGLSCIWVTLGCLAGIVVAWAFLAYRLQEEAEKHDAVSFIDLVSKKHPEMGSAIRVMGSATIVFFFFFYVGAQFLGGGKVFQAMFNIEPWIGMAITMAIIVPYCVYGGFLSVVYTDVIQAVIMVIALGVAPFVGIAALQNMPDVFAHSIPEALSMAGPKYLSLTGGVTGFAGAMVALGGFSWAFGYLGGTPQLSMRFMAIKDRKNAKMGRNIGIVWTLIAYAGALTIGWLGIAIWGPQGLADSETVFPRVMMALFHPVVAATFIVAAMAAMISTADSLLVLASSEFSENILKPYFIKGQCSPAKSLKISRMVTAVIAMIALGAAYIVPTNLIYTIIGYVWAGIGCPFSVVILLTLYWKKYNSKAAFATITFGMAFTIFWIGSGLDTKILTARVVTFAVSLICGVIVTMVTGNREEELKSAA